MEKWVTESSRYIHKSKHGNVRLDRCILPNGMVLEDYCVAELPQWVNIVAINDENEILLIRQFRQGGGVLSLEVVCGCVDDGETYEEAAIRELEEETGYVCVGKPIFLGTFLSNPARQDNETTFFLMNNIKETGQKNFDDTEDLELVKIPFNSVDEYIKNGSIQVVSNVFAISLAKEYLR